jgi:hypothetical protein
MRMSRRGSQARSPWFFFGALVFIVVANVALGMVIGTASAAAQSSSGRGVVPADGRMRGPDFVATVTHVSWPDRNGTEEPLPGRRFVSFTLAVSGDGQGSPTSGTPPLAAALRWDGTSHPLSLASIVDQLSNSAATSPAGASYVASVPNDTHDVDLVLTQGTFSQTFDLWNLRRVPPVPSVLYRDASGPTLGGSAAGPATLALANPADGFTSSATVALQSASLGFFAPAGASLSPTPDQAVLSVVLDGEFPNNPNDLAGSGHYLGSTAPLPASLLSFTPAGGAPTTGTSSDPGDNNGKGNSDDGLFDATYSFLVPATVTSGTLRVNSGSFTGAEFTLYTAESGTTTLDITSPATLALSFTAVPAEAIQTKPPWVGQPLPPTAAVGSVSSRNGSSSGFPIWAAVLILVLVALGVVALQYRRRRVAASAADSAAVVDTAPASATTDAPMLRPDPVVHTWTDSAPRAEEEPGGARDEGVAVFAIGPLEFRGLRTESERRIVYELLAYLAFHAHRHLRVGQIQIGLRPLGSSRPELGEKTLRNYLSEVRALVGPEHLPDASGRDGYLLEGVDSDWGRFQALTQEADALGGQEANRRRAEALALVRGRPFADVIDLYEWVSEEHLATQMSAAIAACAERLATDRLEAGDVHGAEEASRRGVTGAPEHSSLWEIGANAIFARRDRGALTLWMADAAVHLDPSDITQIEGSLEGTHDVGQS